MRLLLTIWIVLQLSFAGNACLNSNNMDTLALEQKISQLISNLQYSSESDYPLELLRWGNKSPEALQAVIREKHPGTEPVQQDAAAFFDKYIRIQENSGDPVMMADAKKYRTLWEFLAKETTSVTVWRNGETRVDIYIIITANDGQLLVLKTMAVET